jgi:hypothetical protein
MKKQKEAGDKSKTALQQQPAFQLTAVLLDATS